MAPAGPGVCWSFQLVPIQSAARLTPSMLTFPAPTAMHAVLDRHDTLSR